MRLAFKVTGTALILFAVSVIAVSLAHPPKAQGWNCNLPENQQLLECQTTSTTTTETQPTTTVTQPTTTTQPVTTTETTTLPVETVTGETTTVTGKVKTVPGPKRELPGPQPRKASLGKQLPFTGMPTALMFAMVATGFGLLAFGLATRPPFLASTWMWVVGISTRLAGRR